MQELLFEPSWEKALAHKDREKIQKIFLETNKLDTSNIRLVPIRQAFNHKGELLITVLIHNFSDAALTFNEKRMLYIEKNKAVAENTFTLPTLFIPSKVSMPWTFIFPAGCWNSCTPLENGHLEIF